ncbi:DUF3971 domain-containing protein [Litorivicinus sp.]|nr:DUF3971 domain-containing protein [Litorivicinus sp.]
MIRGLLTTKAIIVVILAALQGLVLAAFPMVNYWRSDIEAILSERLDAKVTISEIGARASWTGPYLEALNIVIEKEQGLIEIRQVQMLLDLPASLVSSQPVIDQLVLDEGEIIKRGSVAGEFSDPKTWAGLLDRLHEIVEPMGEFQLHNVDVVLGDISFKRLSMAIDPEIGMIAQTRLVTEDISVPLDIDWRYPSGKGDSHDLRLHTQLRQAPVSDFGLEDLLIDFDATAWLTVKDGVPVEGIVRMSGLSEAGLGLSGELSARFELPGLNTISTLFTSLQLQVPGLTITGSGGGLQFDGSRVVSHLPLIEVDGLALGELLKLHLPDSKLIRILTTNQPTMTAQDVKLDWTLDQAPSISTEINTFEIQAGNSIPHIGPVVGDLFIDGFRGWFDFEAKSATFSLPEIFPNPWEQQSLSGLLGFDRSDDGLLLRGQNLRVQSEVQDVRGALLLDLPWATEQSIQLELTVDASTDALADLLPNDLDGDVHDFLIKTIDDVNVSEGRISYSGPLGAAVDRSRRDLSMYFPISTYSFQPLSLWPSFVGTEGVVDFVSKRARVEFIGPDFGGLNVSRVVAVQDREDGRRIHITGQLSGEASVALEVLDEAQVKPDTLGSEVILDGTLRGDVSLTVPIGERPEGQVLIEADDLTVAFSELSEPFTQVNGRATYRLDDGLYTERLSGKLLGDSVEATVTVSDGQTDFVGQAHLRTINLSDLISLGFDESQLYGEADWSIRGRGDDEGFQLSLETDGQGLGSHLPPPLSKETDQVGDIRVSLISTPELKSFNATFFETTQIRGDLGTNPLVLEILTPEVGIIDWANVPARDGGGPNLSILLKTDRLVLGDTPLQVDETAIILKPDEFDVSFDGSEMSGRVWRIGKGSLFIDLTHLVLPEGGDLLDAPDDDPLLAYDPGQLPSANIRVNQLKRGETDYQDMNIILVSGDSRLDATTLEFNRDGQKYQGELAWVFENGRAKSALLLRAQGTGLGNILRVNEDEPLLEAASGRFVSNLTWEGSPLGFSVLTSEGLVELSLEDGRFVDLGNSAEVLRLFGILNIETITRRLRLDFLDLVQPGVAFDRVTAKAKIANGSLWFDPEFEMQGPSSSFRMTGVADLVNQKLNQQLEVDIPLTNNLPLASVLLGAPQVGGAIYLVEKALGKKLMRVGKTSYRIEGSFDDPQVSLIPPFSKKKDNVNADTTANSQ